MVLLFMSASLLRSIGARYPRKSIDAIRGKALTPSSTATIVFEAMRAGTILAASITSGALAFAKRVR
jgi:hypothetical protein